MQDLELLVGDQNGVPRGKTVDGASFAPGDSAHFAASVFFQCINGEYALDAMKAYCPEDGDLLLVPDWTTCRDVPWKSGEGRQVVCETLDKAGKPVPFDPRNVLKRILARYAEQGWTPIVAPEIEFYLLQPPRRESRTLVPTAGLHERAEFGGEGLSTDALDKYAPFLDTVRAMSAGIDIPLQAMMHELGPGQVELNVAHGEALGQVDRLFLVKRLVKACALRARLPGELDGQAGHGPPGQRPARSPQLGRRAGRQPVRPAGRQGAGAAAPVHRRGCGSTCPGRSRCRRPTSTATGASSGAPRRPSISSGATTTVPSASAYRTRTMPAAGWRAGSRAPTPIPTCSSPRPWPAACSVSKKASSRAIRRKAMPTRSPPICPSTSMTRCASCPGTGKLKRLLTRHFVDGFVSVKREELKDLGRRITPWEVGYLGSML